MSLDHAFLTIAVAVSLACILTMSCLPVQVTAQFSRQTVFDDEGTSFWQLYTFGTGSIGPYLTTEKTTVQNGNSSIKISVTSGSYSAAGCIHFYSTKADWSSYDTISFWIAGSNSNQNINLVIMGPNSNSWLTALINDNFTGWRHFSLDLTENVNALDHIQLAGSPDISQVQAIAFIFYNQATILVDLISLENTRTSTTPSPTQTTQASASPPTTSMYSVPPTSSSILNSSSPSESSSSQSATSTPSTPFTTSTPETSTNQLPTSNPTTTPPQTFQVPNNSPQPDFLMNLQDNWLIATAITFGGVAVVMTILLKRKR